MNRRRVLLPTAALLVAVLGSGCVKQPFDQSQLEATEQPGVAAAPLTKKQAERAASKARNAAATKPTRDGTSGGSGTRGGGDQGDADGAAGDDGKATADDGGPGDGSAPNAKPGRTSGTAGDGDGRRAQPPVRRAPRFRVIGKAADEHGDASGEAPAYADVRQLLIESNGSAARVTVALAARIPRALAEGEVQGVGIDLYRSDDDESDYQIFVTGNSGGWEAFLHTPNGVATYPGRFAIGGRVFVFELAWKALGGRGAADVGMFVDWSQERTILNAVGNDRAPNDGRITIRPA